MPERVAWLDVAKGAAIVGVVFYHALYYLQSLDIRFAPYWFLDEILRNIRMPLFFFCAGITASFAAHRTPIAFWRKRLIPLIWVFTVWTGVYVLADQALRLDSTGEAVEYSLVRPQLNFWFVWVLIVFTAAAPLVARINSVIVFSICACLALLWHAGYIGYTGTYFRAFDIEAILNFAPLFVLGLFFARQVLALFNDNKKTLAIFFVSVAVFATVLTLQSLVPRFWSVLDLTASVIGVPVGASTAVLISRVAWPRKVLAKIGEHSLTVYLGHPLLIAVVAIPIAYLGWEGSSGEFLTVLATLLSVWLSIQLRRLASIARLSLLYSPPSFLTRGNSTLMDSSEPSAKKR